MLVTEALRMAVNRRSPHVGLLHHSDRGSTYLHELGLSIALAARGHDNKHEPYY